MVCFLSFLILPMCIADPTQGTSHKAEDRAAKRVSTLYQVSLLNKYYKHYCGGVIVRNNWILSAAACVDVCGDRLMCAVRYGALNINEGRYAPIRIFAAHPRADIALVESPLILQGNVRPITIYTYPLPTDAVLVAEGWRWEKSRRVCHNRLKSVKFERISCLRNESICATALDKKICYGDYGGPLLYVNKLVGISNFGLIDVNVNRSREQSEDETTEGWDYVADYVFKLRHGKYPSTGKSLISEEFNKTLPSFPIYKKYGGEAETNYKSYGRQSPCYSGYGVFSYVPSFISWIDETIREYTQDYGLDDLPAPVEWSADFINRNYAFSASDDC